VGGIVKIKDFDYFYGKHTDKKCLILGGAPSIKSIDYKNFDGIIISMGDIPIRLQNECYIDYWINANSEFPVPDTDFEMINQVKHNTLLFAHSVVRPQNYSIIGKELKNNWFEYDQRHFGGQPCNKQIDSRFHLKESLECCNHIGKTTIQEFLQKKYKTLGHYSTASTVAIHALSLAIILGCKEIYVGGVDIPTDDKDYTYFGVNSLIDNLKNEKGEWRISKYAVKRFLTALFNMQSKSAFYSDISDILKDFEYLNNLCKIHNIALFNVSEVSNLRKIQGFKYISADQISELL